MPDNLKACSVTSYRNTPPQWPAQIVGSISHTRNTAIAAVSSAHRHLAIGIDCESVFEADTSAKVCDLILSNNDKLQFNRERSNFCVSLTTVFSAKESLFKALNPIIKRFFDFRDIDIYLNDNLNGFKATINKPLTTTYPEGMSFTGSIIMQDKTIITYLSIDRAIAALEFEAVI